MRTVSKTTTVVLAGGAPVGQVTQQNVAQEGKQNNNCGNPSNVTLSGPSKITCVAVDESVEIDHPKKKHHHEKSRTTASTSASTAASKRHRGCGRSGGSRSSEIHRTDRTSHR